jgi:hypothetical protein
MGRKISWPDEPSETVMGFLSEADAAAWIADRSPAGIARTETLRKDLAAKRTSAP